MLGTLTALTALTVTSAAVGLAADDDAIVEFHFTPVANAQIAIWIEDANGEHVQDVFVTQATGKFGIGNRPGRWDFLSSWRAPYGARRSTLPVWAGRRGKQYPKIIFFDEEESDINSLGWHENTSSKEPYFCKPLMPAEHKTVSVDTMTCPSPQAFHSDKGQFKDGATSPYPPRNDLLERDDVHDSKDVLEYSALNELDGVTGATPPGDEREFQIAMIPREVVERGPIRAYLEISLEDDQNASWSFDREDDHFVDPRLAAWGVGYLGQPSVVFQVEVDATLPGFVGTSEHVGYGDWDGATGTLHAPDGTLSAAEGSGVDRLREFTLNGETFRWGVYSHGPNPGDDGGPWGGCAQRELPPVQGLAVRDLSFDVAEVSFIVPALPALSGPLGELGRVRLFHLKSLSPMTPETLGAATESSVSLDEVTPGELAVVTVDQLWGSFTYQFAVTYEDRCANTSQMTTASVTMQRQEFQQIEGACFLATAALGAPWRHEVRALRLLRDGVLRQSPIGDELVRFYYTYSPALAAVIEDQALLRSMTRAVVQPVADTARLAIGEWMG